MRPAPILSPVLLLALTACVDRAEVEALLGPAPEAPYPELLPYADLDVAQPGPTEEDAEMTEDILTRAQEVRERAARIEPAR